jgi:hypothetical protein
MIKAYLVTLALLGRAIRRALPDAASAYRTRSLRVACDRLTSLVAAAACVYAAERNVDLRKACEAVRR